MKCVCAVSSSLAIATVVYSGFAKDGVSDQVGVVILYVSICVLLFSIYLFLISYQ